LRTFCEMERKKLVSRGKGQGEGEGGRGDLLTKNSTSPDQFCSMGRKEGRLSGAGQPVGSEKTRANGLENPGFESERGGGLQSANTDFLVNKHREKQQNKKRPTWGGPLFFPVEPDQEPSPENRIGSRAAPGRWPSQRGSNHARPDLARSGSAVRKRQQ